MTNTSPDTRTIDLDLLTYSEAAKLLRVSDRTVWGLVNESRVLPAVRVGQSVRIDRRDVVAFVERRKTGA